jgi:hypothetical protein
MEHLPTSYVQKWISPLPPLDLRRSFSCFYCNCFKTKNKRILITAYSFLRVLKSRDCLRMKNGGVRDLSDRARRSNKEVFLVSHTGQ